MIPALDDAQALAERLRDELQALAISLADERAPAAGGRIQALADDADDLASRIDLTRSGNR